MLPPAMLIPALLVPSALTVRVLAPPPVTLRLKVPTLSVAFELLLALIVSESRLLVLTSRVIVSVAALFGSNRTFVLLAGILPVTLAILQSAPLLQVPLLPTHMI